VSGPCGCNLVHRASGSGTRWDRDVHVALLTRGRASYADGGSDPGENPPPGGPRTAPPSVGRSCSCVPCCCCLRDGSRGAVSTSSARPAAHGADRCERCCCCRCGRVAHAAHGGRGSGLDRLGRPRAGSTRGADRGRGSGMALRRRPGPLPRAFYEPRLGRELVVRARGRRQRPRRHDAGGSRGNGGLWSSASGGA
jgi:hypothetical protein